MRLLYLLLRIVLPYIMLIFYKKAKTINAQKKFNTQTIFVCNHPSAFIDPLVAGNYQLSVLYFVTRGDIFKTYLKPVTWATHLVPIFRKAEDGADSHEKNENSFRYLRKVLMRKKSLIFFGEGYTDNVFIRSLKPIKKGPARIGFDTMVGCDWSEDIKVQTISINYSHPKQFRSDVVVAFGDCIPLKKYKEAFEDNSSSAITSLTKTIEKSMQNNLTYVKNKELAPFVENILILSRKGMNHFHYNSDVKLLSRYTYSKKVANKINNEFSEDETYWTNLRSTITAYFDKLKAKNIDENWVYKYSQSNGSKSISATVLKFILGFPLILLGLIHQFIPYFIIKKFVEYKFKRDVFWSGVKLMLGATISTLYNFYFIFLFYVYIYPSYWLAVLYFLTVPVLSGLFAYNQINNLKDALAYKKADEKELAILIEERAALLANLKERELV